MQVDPWPKLYGLHQDKWKEFSCCKYIDAGENTGYIHLYTYAYNSSKFHFKSIDWTVNWISYRTKGESWK